MVRVSADAARGGGDQPDRSVALSGSVPDRNPAVVCGKSAAATVFSGVRLSAGRGIAQHQGGDAPDLRECIRA